ncbi:hypothetical protein SEA_PROVOLONE_61 [Streptomyces phage Provolone]|nr:hypothetical protein SEA_PROVOLONE_61 [Streptomyces phage Provolone]
MILTCPWMDGDTMCAVTIERRGTGNPNGGVILCPKHSVVQSIRRNESISRFVASYFEQNPEAPHMPGWAYVVLLRNGRIKIGFTTKLADRLVDIHTEYGDLNLLAALPGGRTRAMVLHDMFRELRIDCKGELFEPHNNLLAYAMKCGVPPEAQPDLDTYRQWANRFKLHTTP